MRYRYDYPRPALTVDTVVLTVRRRSLEVLLIRRGVPPFQGEWAIPGGFVRVDDEGGGESVDAAAARELAEETGLLPDDVFLEQLYTFGEPDRDPRGRVVSVAYYALVSSHLLPKVRGGDDAAEARWFPVGETGRMRLAFDHAEILAAALERVRGKIDYDPRLALGLVPGEFTQAELRRAFEAVKGRPIDRGNFSKRFARMREDGLILEVAGHRDLPGAGRPPKLYSLAHARA